MKIKLSAMLLVSSFIILSGLGITCAVQKSQGTKFMNLPVRTVDDVVAVIPTSPEQIDTWVTEYTVDAQTRVDAIIVVPDEQRTYANTVEAFDYVCRRSSFGVSSNIIHVIEMVHPDKAMRDAAHAAIIKIQEFGIDSLSNNVDLYKALKQYATSSAKKEQLNNEQRFFIKEVIDDFERAGLGLPEEQRAEIKKIKKELAELILNFDANIAKDASFILVDQDGLKGLEEDFITTLEQVNGKYRLGVDYPTYTAVMGNCCVEETRKQLCKKFQNRAYPANKELLEKIIAKRDELAKKLGFVSYAHLDLSDQMIGSPARAQEFISDLAQKAQTKEQKEFELFTQDLPESVTLTKDGKLKPWDVSFVHESYKKNKFNIDEQKLAEYFPMEKTIEGLLAIYEKFFSLEFKQVQVSGLWHEDVKLVEVYNANDKKMLGYLLLDLYPRPNKYSHACETVLARHCTSKNGNTPTVSLVIANFPKSTKDKPSLLKRSDVRTFFHEFGHALHEILGALETASLSGTNVKRDFVEMPSQMLEEWLYDKEILKMVSGHYKTGEPLPDDVIDTLISLKNFFAGYFLLRQLGLSLISLNTFQEGSVKDLDAILKISMTSMTPGIAWDNDNHMYASFGHLTNYGAKYYGYMWSRVFALDLFDTIKKHGLLNSEIGQKYIQCVIGCGGSKHPDELLKDFLGRAPNMDAFIQSLGL